MSRTLEFIRAQKCPSCGHLIGESFNPTQEVMPSSKPAALFCMQCLSPIWASPERPVRVMTYYELYSLIALRPNEIIPLLALLLQSHVVVKTGQN